MISEPQKLATSAKLTGTGRPEHALLARIGRLETGGTK
jgi:hypothetical protein